MRVTADVKTATRKRIVEAAQRLFVRDGFEPTTTRDIARVAKIGVGTLFNYFPTKESIVDFLVSDAFKSADEAYAAEFCCGDRDDASADEHAPCEAESRFEEDLFSYVALVLRKLKPYRKYLAPALETSLSSLGGNHDPAGPSLRDTHIEMVHQIAANHELQDALSPVAAQLYWTLFSGILAFWASDRSPRQEDTLALIDQSVAMFVGWLNDSAKPGATAPQKTKSSKKKG